VTTGGRQVRALEVLVENQRRIRDALAGLALEQPLAPRQIILGGERADEAPEHEYIVATGLRRHGVADLERVFDDLDGPVYVHAPSSDEVNETEAEVIRQIGTALAR
jgi:hypothetical protein